MLDDNLVLPTGIIYLVMCSRGSGSECFTAHTGFPIGAYIKAEIEDADDESLTIASDMARINSELATASDDPQSTVQEIVPGLYETGLYGDEGITYVINKPMTLMEVLKGIMKVERRMHEEHVSENGEGEYGKDSILWYSAVYRAVVNNIKDVPGVRHGLGDDGYWSYVDESDRGSIVPEWQVEQFARLMGFTKEELVTSDCPVMRVSIKR